MLCPKHRHPSRFSYWTAGASQARMINYMPMAQQILCVCTHGHSTSIIHLQAGTSYGTLV